MMGNALIVVGIVFVGAGVLMKFGWLNGFGHLPGDLRMEGDGMRLYIPFASMLVVSVLISLVLYWFRR